MILTIDAFNLIALLLIKPLCAIGFCGYLLNSNPVRSAAKNHWLVFLGVLSPLLVLLSYSVLPSLGLPVLPASWVSVEVINVEQLWLSQGAGYLAAVSALTVFSLGVVWGVSYLLNGMLEIHQITRKAEHVGTSKLQNAFEKSRRIMGVNRKVSLKMTGDLAAPVMWGAISPTVLMPKQSEHWDDDVLVRVMAHELAHIKRYDWLVKVAVHLLCCLFWFIAPVWWLAKKNEWFAELACDDLVVEALDCRAEYANDLLMFATHDNRAPMATLGFIKKSELFQRINAVLDGAKARRALARKEKVFLLCVWVGLLAPLSITQAFPVAQNESIQAVEYYPVWLPAPPVESNSERKNNVVSARKTMTLTLEELRKNYTSKAQVASTSESMRVVATAQSKSHNELLGELPVNSDGPAVGEPLNWSVGVEAMSDVEQLAQRPEVQLEGFLPVDLVTPEYPVRALQRGVEGRVKVEFDINTQGKAFNVRVVATSAKGVFDRAVLDALNASQFQPIKINGHPIITKNVNETFLFTLTPPNT